MSISVGDFNREKEIERRSRILTKMCSKTENHSQCSVAPMHQSKWPGDTQLQVEMEALSN